MTANKEPRYGKKYADADLLEWMGQCYQDSADHFSGWRESLPRLFSMYGGKTLSEADRAYLGATNRPEIEFNYCLGTLNAILGQDISNKSEVVFRGQDLGASDQVLGEWLTSGVRRSHQVCKGHLHEWEVLWELLVSGYGWSRGFLDVNRPTILPAIQRAPCWEMYPDPDATGTNLNDMRWLIRERRWTLESIEARWPKKADEVISRAATGDLMLPTHPEPYRKDEWRRMYESGSIMRERVTVREFEYKRFEPYLRYWDPATEELAEVEEAKSEERWLAMEAMGQPRPEQVFPYSRECFYRAHAVVAHGGNHGILLDHEKLSLPSFTYRCATGFRFQNPETGRIVFFGPASVIADAQNYINQSLRLTLELVATSSKGGGFIEEGALKSSVAQFQMDQAKPGYWHVVADDSVSQKRILLKPTQTIPPVVGEFLRLCVDAISTLTGVTDWVKGTATQERSNVLISNLQEQSITMLMPLLEPLKEWRVANGVLMGRLFLQLPDQVINRLIGDEPVEGLTHANIPMQNPETGLTEMQLVPLSIDGEPVMPDPETGEMMAEPATPAALMKKNADPLLYDVVADVGQASPTMKMAVWQVFIQTNLIGTLMEAGIPIDAILPRLIRYLPLPSDMAQSLAADLEARMGQPVQGQEQILQALVSMPEADRMAIIQQAAEAPPAEQGQVA